MAPTEPGSIYGCMEFISLHVRKRYCLSAFYLNFCLCGFRFATTVGRMLLPLSAFLSVLPECHFRGISLLEAALVIPLCGVMLREAASPFSDYSSIMIYAAFLLLTGAVFVVLIVIGPVMRTLSYFDSWGQRKQIRELFCTEYFLMQPVSRNRSFTVTYHLSLMNRTPPVFTIFHFSQTSADGSPRKRKQANGKCSLSQMAEPLKYQSMRPKQPRKCSLMRQTVSMPRK